MAKDSEDLMTENFGSTRIGHDGYAQLSDLVAMHLRERIISGHLKKGEFLRIDAVAKSLHVSMTPVREGLFRLQSESFVTLLPRRGFVVNGFDKQDLLDLFWAQATIAAELAARAATRMSNEALDRLQRQHTEYELAVTTGDRDHQRDRIGHEFHRTINLAAQAPRLAMLLGGLAKQLPNHFYASIDGQMSSAMEYHPLILQAIRLRDANSARTLMFRHLMGGGDHLVDSLERQGMWAGNAANVPADTRGGSARSTAAGKARKPARPARRSRAG